MRSATRPRPIVASMKVSQICPMWGGLEKPRVKSDDPLTSTESAQVPTLNPQNMKEKPIVTRSIQASGSDTRATGAKIDDRRSRRACCPNRCTRHRWTAPKTNLAILVKPWRGRTTVSRAETRTAPTTKNPNRTAKTLRKVTVEPGSRRHQSGDALADKVQTEEERQHNDRLVAVVIDPLSQPVQLRPSLLMVEDVIELHRQVARGGQEHEVDH